MSVFDQEDDQNKDYLSEITGPGGKFDRTKYASDQEMYKAIAKSNVHGDRTISQRNTEFDELRNAFIAKSAEADTAAKLEDLIKKYEERVNRDTTNNPNVGDVTPPELDPKKIEDIVTAKLSEMEVNKRNKANLDVVDSRLKERFGENASAILKDKMNTLGISNEDLKSLAKLSPEAALNALGLNQRADNDYQAPPRSNTRSDNFKPEVKIRDAVYWEKLKNESPKEYFSQSNSVQRLKDMENPDFLKRYRERQGP